MKQNLIVMLTFNDETVKNAKECFLACKDLPVKDWGFKDIGLPRDEMVDLVKTMKAEGKVTNLEIVSLSEEEGLAGAKIAVEAGFDVLMGTVYYDSIRDYLKGTGVKYYPFCGKVYGHPSILDGTIEEVTAHARELEAKGVDGIDLLLPLYRRCRDVLGEVVKAVNIRLSQRAALILMRESWKS